MLRDCKDYVNTDDWFSLCSPICDKFKITGFDPFFEPFNDFMESHIEFLTDKLKVDQKKQETKNFRNELLDIKSSRLKKRILEETTESKDVKEVEKQFSDDQIFNYGLDVEINLTEFTSIGFIDGFSFYRVGLISQLNDEMYETVRKELLMQ